MHITFSPRQAAAQFRWLIGAALLISVIALTARSITIAQTTEPLPAGGADDLRFDEPEEDPAPSAEVAEDAPLNGMSDGESPDDTNTFQPTPEKSNVKPGGTGGIFDTPDDAEGAKQGPSRNTQEPPNFARGYLVPTTPTVQFISEPILGFEESGIITKIPKEGTAIRAGDVIAMLDPKEMELKVDVAAAALNVAEKEAGNQIKVRYAEASAKANEADYMSGIDANRRKNGVVPEMELRRRKLEAEAGKLSIENANYELEIARLSSLVKKAELNATEFALKRMKIVSPISGIVIKREAHDGQFVRAGDPVLQIAQLDRMRVAAYIPMDDISPRDIVGRRVTIEIACGRDPQTGKERQFVCESTIEFVDAMVKTNDSYRVWAEFDNTADFVVRNGMPVRMVIH
jgi:multidrug efflux pump subunit AcrA (membrane-fusion protein)